MLGLTWVRVFSTFAECHVIQAGFCFLGYRLRSGYLDIAPETLYDRSILFVAEIPVRIWRVKPAIYNLLKKGNSSQDVSTPELIRRVAAALGRPARLFPIPPSLMLFAGKLLGKTNAVERLVSSLTSDSSKIRKELIFPLSISVVYFCASNHEI